MSDPCNAARVDQVAEAFRDSLSARKAELNEDGIELVIVVLSKTCNCSSIVARDGAASRLAVTKLALAADALDARGAAPSESN